MDRLRFLRGKRIETIKTAGKKDMSDSLKIKEVVKRLPDNAYNIGKTMLEVGYSKATSRSGQQYARIRKAVEKAYSPEQVKADILKAEAKMLKDNDNSNLCRLIELRAKVLGLCKEVSTANQVNINISDTLDKLKQPKPLTEPPKAQEVSTITPKLT